MNLPFYKLSVGSNDFLLINFMGEAIPDEKLLPVLTARICRRHKGVGGNGAAYLLDHPEAGAKIRYFTAKGRELKRFYDPLMGAARYLFDSGFSGTKAITVEVPTGIRTIEAIDSANFRISLGTPLDTEGTPLQEEISSEGGIFFTLENSSYPLTPVQLHTLWGTVFFENDPRKGTGHIAKAMSGSSISGSSFTPLFVQVYSDDDILVAPQWKKNGHKELSIAAGAAAVSTAVRGFGGSSLMTRIGKQEFFIEWKTATQEILCTGGGEYVFTGDFFFDEASFYGE